MGAIIVLLFALLGLAVMVAMRIGIGIFGFGLDAAAAVVGGMIEGGNAGRLEIEPCLCGSPAKVWQGNGKLWHAGCARPCGVDPATAESAVQARHDWNARVGHVGAAI